MALATTELLNASTVSAFHKRANCISPESAEI
jgi:hypothetical protein